MKYLNAFWILQFIIIIRLFISTGCNNKNTDNRELAQDILIKDNYLLFPGEDYNMSYRHIVIKGINEEIGSILSTMPKDQCETRFTQYKDVVYPRLRLEYFNHNWVGMATRMKGLCKVFGENVHNTVYDASEPICDIPLGDGDIECYAIFFPVSITETGPLLIRNHDRFKITFSEIQNKTLQPGEHRLNERSMIIETHPTDGGYPTVALGGMNLLNPFLDVMNKKGLFITALVDPDTPVLKGENISGGSTTGLSIFQLPLMLAAKCATVNEAKKELLMQHLEVKKGLHWLIADAQENATVFEIDEKDGFVFTDAQPDKPFIVTNYHLYTYREYNDFPKIDPSQEHNAFVRHHILDKAINKYSGKYSRKEVTDIIDEVLCSFIDDPKAGISSELPERTLWSHTTDLAEKNMDVRFYLGDGSAQQGTNHLETRRTSPIRIDFYLKQE